MLKSHNNKIVKTLVNAIKNKNKALNEDTFYCWFGKIENKPNKNMKKNKSRIILPKD